MIYICGHESKPIIMNDSEMSLAMYLDWMENNPEDLCFRCWLDRKLNRNVNLAG